ncbi:MAG: aminoglycoside phosphotransferase family protein [Gammaproteobacteria bacterium]|nr:aminoglycoside phosphotransferase family protein [Gammaproteobacteria bacterium]
MQNKQLEINEKLVRKLISAQFPQWKNLPVLAVDISGWDNRTFHLGQEMLVRMPSAVEYAAKVEIEQEWLPKLAPFLPLPIPEPLAMGQPTKDYPWQWSIYRWIKGDTVTSANITDLNGFAASLAEFLTALQRINTAGGPVPGEHNFYRGGTLTTYDAQTRQALSALTGKVDTDVATEIWEIALNTAWDRPPVWVHGDISAGNLLVDDGRLCAVIDFGGLAIGDPACDLAIAWTLFKNESREIFFKRLALDTGTWARGRAWTLWKALIVAAGLTNPNNTEAQQSWNIINDIIKEHKNIK